MLVRCYSTSLTICFFNSINYLSRRRIVRVHPGTPCKTVEYLYVVAVVYVFYGCSE